MSDSTITLMSLLFAAAHSARYDRSLQYALQQWRETGVVPVAKIVPSSSKTAELPITLAAAGPSARKQGPVS